MITRRALLLAGLLSLAVASSANDDPGSEAAQDNAYPTKLRDLCSARPGRGTPACTVDPGHRQIELDVGDWTLDRTAESRSNTIEAGEIALRYGIVDHRAALRLDRLRPCPRA